MNLRVKSRAPGRTLALLALIAAASSLSGCSSLGMPSLPSTDAGIPFTTGSVGPTAQGNLSQQMPGALKPMRSSGSGRYLPPTNIGANATPGSIITGSTVNNMPPVIRNGANSVRSQELPALTTSRSHQTMSAQSMPAQLSPKPMEVALAPTRTSAPIPLAKPNRAAPIRPGLKVVPENAYSHQIASGESLYTIARRYGVTTDSIVHANDMVSPDKIFVGQMVMIPGVKGPATSAPVDHVQTASITPAVKPQPVTRVETKPLQVAVADTKPVPAPVAKPAAPVTSSDKFRWPVNGTVISDFNTSKNGINIAVQEGTAVRAAASGMVLYVGNAVEGYGNLVLIKHDNGYVSAYAHLKDITVAKGDTVGRGDAVGSAGMTGSVARPQLHFELRRGAAPVDPMPLLAS